MEASLIESPGGYGTLYGCCAQGGQYGHGAIFSIGVTAGGAVTGHSIDIDAAGTGITASTGAWHFFAAWRTGGHIYLSMDNGAPVDCGAWSYTINDSGKGFGVGREGDRVANPWGGSIASVGLWKGRALSAGELTELYNHGNGLQYLDLPGGLLSDLISWWDLQEASGTRADSAGSNNLTENGTVGQASGIPGKYPSYTASYDLNGNQTVLVDAAGNRTTN